jgi:hypothetical protein
MHPQTPNALGKESESTSECGVDESRRPEVGNKADCGGYLVPDC